MNAPSSEVVVVTGEGFAFFRWHCLRWPTIIDCCTFHGKTKPECVLYWGGFYGER